MRLESALELQSRIFAQIFDFQPLAEAAGAVSAAMETFVDPLVFEDDRKAARARRSDKHKSAEDIALGVSEGSGAENSKLAVLVQDRRKVNSVVVDEISAMAPGEIEVIYIGRQRAMWPQTGVNPLKLGSSISTVQKNAAGTLGCFCRCVDKQTVGILSNNHVIADVNNSPTGTQIVQPGRLDGGVPGTNAIAVLDKFVPIQFGGMPNSVDAAFAALSPHGRHEDRAGIFDCSVPPVQRQTFVPASAVSVLPETVVHKTGRTTCHTTGKVRAINVNNYLVNYGSVGTARFDGQITVEMNMNPARPFSRPGDSGSIIVDDSGQPVALLFAGSKSGGAGNLGITGANPISSVMAQLGVVLI